MEKEKVLEIEFQPVFDKWAWRVIKQNGNILKRGEFYDEELNVKSLAGFCFDNVTKELFIKGNKKEYDDCIEICTTEEKALIEEKVKAINEKYGIKKRWRAGIKEEYYLMYSDYSVIKDEDCYTKIDTARYDFGNYFKTENEALEYAEYIKKKSLEWHESRENNE